MKKRIEQDLGPVYWLVDVENGRGPIIEISEEEWKDWQDLERRHNEWQERLDKLWSKKE